MKKFLKAFGETLLDYIKKMFLKKQKLSWKSLIPYTIIFFLVFILLNMLFIVSIIIFFVFLIWLLVIAFNPHPNSFFPRWMLRIFALSVLFIILSLVISVFVPNENLGNFVVDTNSNLIYVDSELDSKTNLYVSIINLIDFKTHEQTLIITEDKTIDYEVEYLENVTENIFFPVVVSGKSLTPIRVSDTKKVECSELSCKLEIIVINLRNEFDVDVDVSYNILVYENQENGPMKLVDTESENYGVVRISALSSRTLKTHVIHSPKEFPYFSMIDPDSVRFKFIANDNIQIVNETRTTEVVKFLNEQKIETITSEKTVSVVNSFFSRLLIRIGMLV